MKLLFRIFLWALICAAQAQDTGRQPASVNASIRGEVKDSVSGRPLANYMVSTSVNATKRRPGREPGGW